MKTLLSYVPHGIDHNHFFIIDTLHPKYSEVQEFRKKILMGKDYDFVLLFNSRNIRRKQIPDTIMAFKIFLDQLPAEKAEKCCLLLHTLPVEEHGTDLNAVREMIFGDKAEHHIIFTGAMFQVDQMNLLYNMCDGVILLSSNEGWGLSITEGLMTGKVVIGNVTGGIQDQARFEDENGDWINFNEEFTTNEIGKYKKCGKWFLPVFPSNQSLQGSPVTPYIVDARINYTDAAVKIMELYSMSEEERKERGEAGRVWVTSNESGMTVEKMADNFIQSVDQMLDSWKPREKYEIVKIGPRKKKFVKASISK